MKESKTSFYTKQELSKIGFKFLGDDVKISRYARIYGAEHMSIGNNVRIDDFCILSGSISLGNNIHISAFSALYGVNGIILEDYTGISARSTLYSALDDFSGDYLIGPIHPKKFTNVNGGEIILRKFSQLGANVVVFPNVEIGQGSAIGAFSLVKESLSPWGIYCGVPVKKIKERSRGAILLEY